ncbi:MAG TPA: hypothetical protein VLE43_00845 [Candidatus Saccharimonadia bacterium]|nr:hypothetical protein [Candidatus Saccharimonadia bacterium]
MRSITLFSLVCMMMALSSVHAAEHEVQIAVGMNRDEATALMVKHSAEDITAHVGLGVLKPGSVRNLTGGIYWKFRDYDAVVRLFVSQDGEISGITFWKKADWEHSKTRREETAQAIKTLKLDTKSRTVGVEKATAPSP